MNPNPLDLAAQFEAAQQARRDSLAWIFDRHKSRAARAALDRLAMDTPLPQIVRDQQQTIATQAAEIERLRKDNALLMRRDYERHLDDTHADPARGERDSTGSEG